jgi:cellulose synthase/poly-beta-1,6-N-acetylglucosamine synthase-like glycosyltransferase
MIIQILSSLYDEGYVSPKEGELFLCAFFNGGNVAFRKDVVEKVGAYDEACLSGEDQDICMKIAKAGYELYFEPKAIVMHKNRKTLIALFKQWFNYGYHHPYLIKKHDRGSLAVYIKKAHRKNDPALYKPVIKLNNGPVTAVIFLTSFLVMNLLFFSAIVSLLFGGHLLALISGVAGVALFIHYFRDDMSVNVYKTLCFIFLKYLVNGALLISGIMGGLKQGIFYLAPTLDYKD